MTNNTTARERNHFEKQLGKTNQILSLRNVVFLLTWNVHIIQKAKPKTEKRVADSKSHKFNAPHEKSFFVGSKA
jgi:hypothetical protein